MKILRPEIVAHARAYLRTRTRASFLTFLSSKYAGVNEVERKPLDWEADRDFIRNYLKEDRQFINLSPYNREQSDLYSDINGLAKVIRSHRDNRSTFYSMAFEQPEGPGSHLYKFTQDYTDITRQYATRGSRLSLALTVIWLYRNHEFKSSASLHTVKRRFIRDFNVTDQELSEIFEDDAFGKRDDLFVDAPTILQADRKSGTSATEAKSRRQLPKRNLVKRENERLLLEKSFIEGERRATSTVARSPSLRIAAKKQWGLKCYCCGFDFRLFYGSVAAEFAIVHHVDDFASTKGKRATKVEGVRIVCANCHHILHLNKPPMDVNNLKKRISKSWHSWTKNGVRRKRRR